MILRKMASENNVKDDLDPHPVLSLHKLAHKLHKQKEFEGSSMTGKSSRTAKKIQYKTEPPDGHPQYCASLMLSSKDTDAANIEKEIDDYIQDRIMNSNLESESEDQMDLEIDSSEESVNDENEEAETPDELSDEGITLFGIDVTTDDLQTLKPNVWIADTVIDVFLLLLKEYAAKKRELKILPFPAFMVTSIMDETAMMNSYSWSEKVELWSQQVWLLPENINKAHWTLLIIVPELKEMVYLDSLHKYIPDNLLTGIRSFMDLIPNTEDRKVKPKKNIWKYWTVHQPADIPKQTSRGGNCGAHVMTWSYVLVTSMSFKFSEAHMNHVRNGVAMVLTTSKTSEKKDKKMTEITESLMSEPRGKLEHKETELSVIKEKPNVHGTLAYIVSLAYDLYDKRD
ncbi:hypothetical protein HCN44_011039 [Aphidius gifuensis]|uniref:Ubiquitin-like protease family profile domain-containing protein n=1 Tax=Aphidius gifuensis TaxID=684658 RepID=A0A834Y5U0_APHGI|nr:hypothetical protein HCN44_011039 [Aphidius gifuensis]